MFRGVQDACRRGPEPADPVQPVQEVFRSGSSGAQESGSGGVQGGVQECSGRFRGGSST